VTSFESRTAAAGQLRMILERLWQSPPVRAAGVWHEPLGYETHVSREAMAYLQSSTDPTSSLLRYFPDAALVRYGGPAALVEHKVMLTPRYTLGQSQWAFGQVEAAAWDVYMRLRAMGVRIAVLAYCPYHPRPLLTDYADDRWIVRERTRPVASQGSGTPYVNVELSKLRPISEFLVSEFGVDGPALREWLAETRFWASLRVEPALRTRHHPSSRYANCRTGFNWEEPYS